VVSFMALVVIAAVSLVVYALTPFRSERSVPGRPAVPHGVSRPVTHARTTGAPRSP
jgi:hypothetical protein